MRKIIQGFAPFLLYFVLIGLGYILARLAVAFLWAEYRTWLVGLLLLLTLGLSLAYVLQVRRRGLLSDKGLYLCHPIDALAPPLILFLVTIILLYFLFLFVLYEWGQSTTGTILDLYIQEHYDPETGSTTYYQVTYEFRTAREDRYTGTASVSRQLYSQLSIGEPVTVYYLPIFPRISVAGDPLQYTNLVMFLLWGNFVVLLWFCGASLTTWLRNRPPSPPLPILQQYGLDCLLTAEDDEPLWTAVVSKHFPPLDSDKLKVANLRFGIGQVAEQTRYKIQPAQAWCFERINAGRLRVIDCQPDHFSDTKFDEALQDQVKVVLFSITFLGNDWPYYSIVLPRPTAREKRVPVFTGAQWGSLHGYGHTAIWERQEDNTWQQTKEVLNWWAS